MLVQNYSDQFGNSMEGKLIAAQVWLPLQLLSCSNVKFKHYQYETYREESTLSRKL